MMLKKKNFCILIAVILIVIFSASTKVFASEYNFAIQERRKCGYGYIFPVNSTNKYIWKIVGYDTPGDITGKTPNYDIPAYCLKAEKGFFSENGVRSSAIEYDKQYNMKTQKEDIINASIMTSDSYDKVLWILDNLYLPKDATDEERTAYLTKTGVLSGNTTKSDLTNDDIEVVQQMAIWYFTNGESDNYKNETLPALWVHKDKGNEPRNDTEYASLSDVFDNRTEDTWEGTYRLEDAAQLYSYIIEEAKKITTYEPTFITNENRPVTKVDTTVKIEQSGNNYIVGPYKLQKNNDAPYTLTVDIKNQDNNDISGYKILKSDKTEETSNNINNLIGQEFYISVPKSNNTQVKLTVNIKYDQKQIDLFTVGNAISATQPIAVINKTSDNYNIESTTLLGEFDLSLRKFITAINGNDITTRIPNVDVSGLKNGETTAKYNHTKAPLSLAAGDIITYTIRVYNEGNYDGYASQITDHIPDELEFLTTDTENIKYGWQLDSTLRNVTTNYLDKDSSLNVEDDGVLKAFDKAGNSLSYKEVKIRCKVKETAETGKKITNIAEITQYKDEGGNILTTDRDSKTEGINIPADENLPSYKDTEINSGVTYIPGQEDDDDFEKVYIPEKEKNFDLALRKSITKINGQAPSTSRLANVDASNLGNGATTAKYNHPKNALETDTNQIVEFTLRVYNEGEKAGYAGKIVDHLPEGLEFVQLVDAEGKYTAEVSSDKRTVTITNIGKTQIPAYTGNGEVSYEEVKLECKVTKEREDNEVVLTNIAEITEYVDGTEVVTKDIDSEPNNFPSDKITNDYNGNGKDGDYVPGIQDDDDFEKIIIPGRVKKFDLALRKFITGVNETEVTDRIPQLSVNTDGTIKYNHTKEPVLVENGNVVTYTLRIYNEGEMAGYASEITDDVPEGLEYLPDNEINKEYRWQLSGNKITTDYLSKEQEKEAGANLIKAYDKSQGITDKNPDYRDIKIAFKVTEPNTSDRILVNTAEISKDADAEGNEVDDIDSTPGNNKDGEDDIDKEYVRVKYFDLALKKWVSKTIIIEDGKETVTPTGHTGEENPEPAVKVELHRKKLSNVTVKFGYMIKITNEGEIEGYAKEITDYIPEGLKFEQEDNKMWTIEGTNKVTTRALEDTLLRPGESASVEIVLTWINSETNMGLKTNIAEISEDYNESDTPDIDSTPDNQVPGEDDIDDAPVLLSIETGQARIYYALTGIILITIAGGIVLIKKYVL